MDSTQERPEFEEVFARYRTALRRYILSMVRSDAETDDLVQETFVRVLRKLDTLENPAMLSPWLYRIATNVSRDRFRKTARDPVQVASDDSDDEAVDTDARLADLFERNEMSSCVHEYLHELPDHYRSAILLHDVEGMTIAEMARMLDATPGALKIRLHRARARLRQALQEACAFSHDEDGVFVCERK
jgi:RNA polymerase sigma-70 factor (ECF subfamily)